MNHYTYYKKALSEQSYPLACLDWDLLEKNRILNLQRAGEKRIRIASKSIRCPDVLQFLLESDSRFQGIMVFHGLEAAYLAERGFDDILLGYPVVDPKILHRLGRAIQKGTSLCLMVDSAAHLNALESVGQHLEVQFPICLDIDLSYDITGLHFGVWRSGIVDEQSLLKILEQIKSCQHVKLEGLMGYEAQIAGVGDRIEGAFLKSAAISFLKKRSLPQLQTWREKALAIIRDAGFELRFVNGGGTGSLESTRKETAVSEVTVGSGFFHPHLFDQYRNFELHPALFFGIQIVRIPKTGIYTCQGGGYIASGSTDSSKAPRVYLPPGGRLDQNEGAGEVQTPVIYRQKTELAIGDPIFLRHAKAGEICEHFNELLVLKAGKLEQSFLTYRGLGLSFG